MDSDGSDHYDQDDFEEESYCESPNNKFPSSEPKNSSPKKFHSGGELNSQKRTRSNKSPDSRILSSGSDCKSSCSSSKGEQTSIHHSNGSHGNPVKKLPPPPAKFTAMHGGPIKPDQDSAKDLRRVTKHQHHGIDKPPISRHKFNEKKASSLPPPRSTSSKSIEGGLTSRSDTATPRENEDGSFIKVTVQSLAQKHQVRRRNSMKLTLIDVEEDIAPKKSSRRSVGTRPQLHIEIEDSNAKTPQKQADYALHRKRFGGGLELDLMGVAADECAMEKSYDFSESGAINIEGFQIKQEGITRTPERATTEPNNVQKNLIKLSILGKGASGIVHKALHLPSMQLVAVKVIPVFENEKRHQMVAELQALYNNLVPLTDDPKRATSPCPFIVSFYDAFINPNEGNISIVVEYMDGGSLQDIVDTGGCSSENVLANISYRVLQALAFNHERHQIHRDIKPSNLLINHRGDVKVSDFGIVRDLENSMAKASTFVGTLTYMSPERIAGEEYSYTSDIWSLGLSVLTCAVGEFPYCTSGGYWGLLHSLRDEPAPKAPADRFSPEFCDFIDQCLKKNKDERMTAKKLLSHPFLQGCGTEEDDEISMSEDDGSETSRSELHEISLQVMKYYMDKASILVQDEKQDYNQIIAWLRTLPTMQMSKLNNLADQLGLNREVVRMKFEIMMNDLAEQIRCTYF